MEDVLELEVEENEFSCEEIKPCEPTKVLGGKNFEQPIETDTKFPINPNDYLTLDEAKRELLERLKTFGDENTVSVEEKDVKPSVKSRLGVFKGENDVVEPMNKGSIATNDETKVVRLPVKSRLGVLETQDDDEGMMDCDMDDETEGHVEQHQWNCENGSETPLKPDDGGTYQRYGKKTTRREDIPRRPLMTKLCKRLRVKYYHDPVKIGKEIAERLEERKFNLIINVVKTIGGEKAIELFEETKKMQLNGGMHTSNGQRRRTSGGVFLTLLKQKYATEEEVKKILRDDSKVKTEKVKLKRTLQRQRKRERERQKKAEEEMKVEEEDSNSKDMNTEPIGNSTVT